MAESGSEPRRSGAAADEFLARRLARQLTGEEAHRDEIARWQRALPLAPLVRERDRRLWALLGRSPALIPVVDGGLALSDPHSPVRHRLCLMLAVLEASPHHTRRFLARESPKLALLGLALRMVVAASRAALGLVLVQALAWVWRGGAAERPRA